MTEPMQADTWAWERWPSAQDYPERDAAREGFIAGHVEGYEQAIRDVVVMAKQRKDEWSFAISNGLQRISVSKSYADGAADEADALTAAILKLLENRT